MLAYAVPIVIPVLTVLDASLGLSNVPMVGGGGRSNAFLSVPTPAVNAPVQLVRFGVISPAAGPGTLRSASTGAVTNSTLLQVRRG